MEKSSWNKKKFQANGKNKFIISSSTQGHIIEIGSKLNFDISFFIFFFLFMSIEKSMKEKRNEIQNQWVVLSAEALKSKFLCYQKHLFYC